MTLAESTADRVRREPRAQSEPLQLIFSPTSSCLYSFVNNHGTSLDKSVKFVSFCKLKAFFVD